MCHHSKLAFYVPAHVGLCKRLDSSAPSIITSFWCGFFPDHWTSNNNEQGWKFPAPHFSASPSNWSTQVRLYQFMQIMSCKADLAFPRNVRWDGCWRSCQEPSPAPAPAWRALPGWVTPLLCTPTLADTQSQQGLCRALTVNSFPIRK